MGLTAFQHAVDRAERQRKNREKQEAKRLARLERKAKAKPEHEVAEGRHAEG